MAGHLVAPRPVRLGTSAHIPFFLQGIPSTSPAPNPPALSESLDPSSQSAHEGQRPSPRPASRSPGNSNEFTTRDGRSIEELAASIRLDDEPQPSVSVSVPVPAAVPAPVRGPAVETLTNRSTCRWNAEDAFISPVPPRSPEAAALDEFLSILRPVIRVPSSPIARSKRLVPRSRHNHHHGLNAASTGATCDRHHPYARIVKSSSPQTDTPDGHLPKKNTGRSPAIPYSRRRHSNANDSSHSAGSTSISSSRSQSISRCGSEGSFNAWRASSPPPPMPMDIKPSTDSYDPSEPRVASLLFLSGMSPQSVSPDPQ